MLKTYRTTWGVQSESWETLFPYLKEQGFSGIEASLLDIGFPNADRFLNLLKKHDLSWICGAYSNWDNYAGVPRRKPVSEHVEQLRGQLKGALALDPKPVRINCHSGSDDFSEDEAREYFTAAVAMEKELGGGVPICHETHRGRILYSPYVALRVVKEFPSMKFTLDVGSLIIASLSIGV
ncbi:hypothetical protein HK101_009355 [Irineochytrium annulatum]|nr:hypothetical protein HK101_009355 [Irineochytrium annulatum]